MSTLFSINPVYPGYLGTNNHDYNYLGEMPEVLLRSYDKEPMIVWGGAELYIKSYRTLKGATAVMLDKAYILDESGECERIGQKYRKYLPYEPF